MPRGVRNVQVPGQAAQAESEAPKSNPENPPAEAEAPNPQSIPPLGPQVAEMAASAVSSILRAKDVDPSKLKRAVVTADGWVCPEKSPAPTAKE